MSMDKVKQLIARTFAELGVKEVFKLRETLFLDKGRCLAVAYKAEALSAVFCCTDGIIEFRNARGPYCGPCDCPKTQGLRQRWRSPGHGLRRAVPAGRRLTSGQVVH